MAASLRLTLFLGICLFACSETAPDGSATSAGSGGSASGGAPGSATSAGETGGASSNLTTTSPTSTDGSSPSGISSSVTGSASLTGSATGGAGPGATGGTDSGGTDNGGTDSGGSSGPAAGGSTAGAGGSAGSAGNSSAGAGGSGAGGSGGTSEPSLESFTLAVIGSSTAAGEGASRSSLGWVSLLASELEDRVVGDFVSKNLSVGGYATSNLMPGSNSNGNIDDAVEEAPNLIIVALAGSNDLSNGVSTETFLDRLATIRDIAVEAGIPVFFVSTAPKDLSDDEREALLEWTNQMRQEFDTCWTPGADSYSPCLIDVFEALANSSLGIADEFGSGDGIHLNDAGHQRLFEIAEGVVGSYVCSLTACAE